MSTSTGNRVRVLYTAEGVASGGRRGQGRSSDGRLDVLRSVPAGLGGDDGPGTNPEQLFAVGYAACFHRALQTAARLEHVSVDGSTAAARIGIGPGPGSRYGFEIELIVTLPGFFDRSDALHLAELANKRCPHSNAVNGNVDVNITVISPDAQK